MRRLREWFERLRNTWWRRRSDADLEEELRLHLELAAEDARRGGRTPEDARRDARLVSGGALQAMEALRERRGVPWLEDFGRDTRYTTRALRRSPGFTAVALLTLALGIGANTAIFSVVNGVLLRPLSLPQPDRLVRVTARFPGDIEGALSYPEYVELKEMSRSFAHLGAFTIGRANTGGGSGVWAGEVNLAADNHARRVRAAGVDDHLLAALGVQPVRGRLFAPGETDALASRPGLGGPPLVILSHELWQTVFAGRAMVGETVTIDGRPHDVIGIMPAGVGLMDARPQIWLPLGVHPVVRQIRTSHVIDVVGRLRDGVTRAAAEAELDALLRDWAERTSARGHAPTARPQSPDEHRLALEPLQEAIVADAARVLWLLQGAVGFVLLIVCANLASLVLARAESRRHELAVRAAIGASRGRLIRQALTEGVLLSVAGGLLGAWLAVVGVEALVLTFPASLPRIGEVVVDSTVLSFVFVVSVGTGMLFGLAPAAAAGGHHLQGALTTLGVRHAGGAGGRHMRGALVAVEVALAMMLVLSAGLLLRTVHNLAAVDAGFERSGLVTFSLTLPRGNDYEGGRAHVYARLLDTLRGMPGVSSATAMSYLPLQRVVQAYGTRIERSPSGEPVTAVVDYYQFVMADYFETMRVPIVAGRSFVATDTRSRERVAIVSETLARTLWSGRDPIGQRIRPNLSASIGASGNPWHTVIGVAKDVKEGGVASQAGSELYLFAEQPAPSLGGPDEPWTASVPPTMHVVFRTDRSPAALAETLEGAVQALDPAVPIVRLREMDAVFAESIRRPRLLAVLIGGFAALALLLALSGTYGVLSYSVSSRRREIGVRLALGATRAGIVSLVLRQGVRPVAIGIVAGVAGSLILGRVLATSLFGVQPNDPFTLSAVVVAMVLVAIGACWMPAWRAARLDPIETLRQET